MTIWSIGLQIPPKNWKDELECKLQQMNWGPMTCSFNASKTFQNNLININNQFGCIIRWSAKENSAIINVNNQFGYIIRWRAKENSANP